MQRIRDQFQTQAVNGSASVDASYDGSEIKSPMDGWNTTNREFYKEKDLKEIGLHKRNFKRKTPFTQWSNAYFGNGVFFNPPVQGI